MPTRNVFLSELSDSFIAERIADGHFSDASEVVGEGLRLLQQRDADDRTRLEELRCAVRTGIDEIERGEGLEFASIDDLADHIRVIGREVSEEVAASPVRD